ncbi:glycosyltransferase [Brachybacterium sp. p3-SID1565]|uniref:glycosyltransferase family 2 protein n=1 Tax=Brachybacterium sp. p3-SID1565 TaxID=2916046 RepID=UPI0021A78493|nr:glycosyltransferase [Brachybacterium sp. p3-SID1565]MCT1384206.1 glycosyltransferase [Brachybacterium sp. p3-SID1565]
MRAAGPLTTDRPTSVAVVIPAKNEAERIEATIEAARRIDGVDLVVVVDDGSTDATAAVAMGADALVVRHKTNRGKAAAMATGAQLVAMREDAHRADGGEAFREELHAEPRVPGHTGPLPVIDADGERPRALLFLDADMEGSGTAAQPLVDAVLGDGVDMAIALLPPQDGAAGLGIVVRTARSGILRATGWEPTQPLSGTRCITRETWDACQPLAPGWGVETSLTIDALTGGFWVKEIECDLHHRATGRDLSGQLHRARQLKDVLRALARRRHVTPDEPAEDDAATPSAAAPQAAATGTSTSQEADAAPGATRLDPVPADPAPPVPDPAHPGPAEVPGAAEGADRPAPVDAAPDSSTTASDGSATSSIAPARPHEDDTDDEDAWSVTPDTGADDRADRRRAALQALPVAGTFSDDQTRALGDVDAGRLDGQLRALPVAGAFEPDDVVLLAGVDLDALAERLRSAPVSGPFDPQHAVIIASHLDAPEPVLPPSIVPPLTADEYTSLVVHAAVDAENDEH